MPGEGIGKQGRLALVFNLRIIIVCRRLSTTHGKTAVKGNLALGLSGEIQGVIHIELILKDERKRGNFIGQEERESTFPTKKPPCGTAREPMRTAAERKDNPKGRAWGVRVESELNTY